MDMDPNDTHVLLLPTTIMRFLSCAYYAPQGLFQSPYIAHFVLQLLVIRFVLVQMSARAGWRMNSQFPRFHFWIDAGYV